jgi:hypothetical protein
MAGILSEVAMAKNKPVITPEDRRRDGERALEEQRAKVDAVNKNMARLRALRLEREKAGEIPEEGEKKTRPRRPAIVVRYLNHQRRIGRV